MNIEKRLRNLIAAFETERAEVDILRSELQDSYDTMPERLHGSEEQEALRIHINTLDLIHNQLNDVVFNLYYMIGEKPDGQ